MQHLLSYDPDHHVNTPTRQQQSVMSFRPLRIRYNEKKKMEQEAENPPLSPKDQLLNFPSGRLTLEQLLSSDNERKNVGSGNDLVGSFLVSGHRSFVSNNKCRDFGKEGITTRD